LTDYRYTVIINIVITILKRLTKFNFPSVWGTDDNYKFSPIAYINLKTKVGSQQIFSANRKSANFRKSVAFCGFAICGPYIFVLCGFCDLRTQLFFCSPQIHK
jgi:hypothetical protein